MNCENNIKIANYIGMQKTDLGWFDSDEVLSLPNESNNTFDILRFNSDWNWLLSVTHFLNKLFDYNNLDFELLTYKLQDSTIDNNITMAYNEVIKFIDGNNLPIEK